MSANFGTAWGETNSWDVSGLIQQRFNNIPHWTAELGMLQGQRDRPLQESELVAAIIALPLEQNAVNRLAVQEHPDRIGNLDFSPRIRRCLLDRLESLPRG